MPNKSIKPLSLPIKGVLVLLIIGLLYTAYVAVCRGVADYYSEQAYQVMLAWSKGEKLTDERWQDAHLAMVKALELDPNNPTYLHRMGRLYHIHMMSPFADVRQFREQGEVAKQYFRDSIAMRRTWPLTWANLALVKNDLGEYDDEMDEAVRSAATYGPWEPGVHRILAVIGLSRGYRFSHDLQLVLAENIKRGLLSPVAGAYRRMEAILDRYPEAVTGEVADTITRLLMEEEWDKFRQQDFVRLGFRLFSRWDESTRGEFIAKILVALRQGDHLAAIMKLVEANDQLRKVCENLVGIDAFGAYCEK